MLERDDRDNVPSETLYNYAVERSLSPTVVFVVSRGFARMVAGADILGCRKKGVGDSEELVHEG